MERLFHRCTLLVQVSDYFYIPFFTSRSNWERAKKMKTKSIVFTSLLCLEVSPLEHFEEKSLKTFIAPYIIICLFSFSTHC